VVESNVLTLKRGRRVGRKTHVREFGRGSKETGPIETLSHFGVRTGIARVKSEENFLIRDRKENPLFQ